MKEDKIEVSHSFLIVYFTSTTAFFIFVGMPSMFHFHYDILYLSISIILIIVMLYKDNKQHNKSPYYIYPTVGPTTTVPFVYRTLYYLLYGIVDEDIMSEESTRLNHA
jgi:hypothetical protein